MRIFADPLVHAAVFGNDVEKVLNELTSVADYRGPFGWTAMCVLARFGPAQEALDVGRQYPRLIEEPDENGWTPIFHAAYAGRWSVVDTLIKYRGQSAQQTDCYGQTLLHVAIYGGNAYTVELICKAGAQVYMADRNGITCTALAAKLHGGNLKEIVKQSKTPKY